MRKIFILISGAFLLLGPLAAGNAEVIFQDDFDDGDFDGWTHIIPYYGPDKFEPGSWTVVDGHLQCTAPSIAGWAQDLKLESPPLPECYILEFDTITLVDGGGSSLIGFYVHWFNWYNRVGHGYRPPGINYSQWISVGEGCRPVQKQTYQVLPDIDEYAWHHVKFTKIGPYCSLEFDDELLFSYSLYTLPIGLSDGHLVLTGCPGTNQFDNVVITEIPVPDVSGCINFQGSALKGSQVILRQSREPKQITWTDENGCFGFDINLERRFWITIRSETD